MRGVAGCSRAFCNGKGGKIRVKNREPVPVYAMEMDPQERDSDLGDDSPVVSAELILVSLSCCCAIC